MSFPAITASQSVDGISLPAPHLDGVESALVRRGQMGLFPLIFISLGATALAIGQALRPAGQMSVSWGHGVTIVVSIVVAVVMGAFAVTQIRGRGRWFLGTLWFYLGGAFVLMLALAVLAILDRGLHSVAYAAVTLVAAYAGLAFPRRWSRGAVAGLLVVTAVVAVARPGAGLVDTGTVFVLIPVGWAMGLLPRIEHRKASLHALLLSRCDALTGVLNRRGFMEQFAHDLGEARVAGRSFALLVVDLNGFKLINDRDGHAAGDAMLSWVGASVPDVLPRGAALGRLGGDEFAITLPGAGLETAVAIAEDVQKRLRERVGAAIGIAFDTTAAAEPQSLLRAADEALYAAKADPVASVRSVLAPRPAADAGRGRQRAPDPPQLTFEGLRAAGGLPATFTDAVFDGWAMLIGFSTIALAGVPIVADNLLSGGDSFFEEVLRYGGVPWIVTNLALAWISRNHAEYVNPPRATWWLSAALLGGGVGAAALASGEGIAAPIMAGLVVKLLVDASIAPRRFVLENAVVIGFFWLLVLSLGPEGARWAAPYALVIMVAATVLGSIGRAAFETARTARIQIASTDPLTGLLNRRGFEAAAIKWVAKADAGDVTLAVLAFDLDNFKEVNDRQGHAAGDELLRSVAQLTRDALPAAYAVGRAGGDEFVALVPVPAPAALQATIVELDRGLSALAGGSIGSAIHGEDGTAYELLLGIADARAYAVKQERRDGRRTHSSTA